MDEAKQRKKRDLSTYPRKWTPEEAKERKRERNRINSKRRKAERAVAAGRIPGCVGGQIKYFTSDEKQAARRIATARWRERNIEAAREADRVCTAKRRAKKRAGGSYTIKDIRHLWYKQKGKCAFCLKRLKPRQYHIDHYIPLSRGGTNDPGNLRLLHPLCNLEKSASDPLDHALKNGLLCW